MWQRPLTCRATSRPVSPGIWMSRNSTSGACASTSRRVAMPSPVCATTSSSGQREPSSSASSSRSSGSSSAMMARGLGSTSLCSHATRAVASRRVACIAIPMASERPGGGAILARQGLVSRQVLPFRDDDDALDLLRRELPLGAADHRGVYRHQCRSVHADRDAQGQQTNSLFHGNLPLVDAYRLRAPMRPRYGHATKRPIARTKRALGRRTIAMIAESRQPAYPVLAMSTVAAHPGLARVQLLFDVFK